MIIPNKIIAINNTVVTGAPVLIAGSAGTVTKGGTYTCTVTPASWSPAPTRYSYMWEIRSKTGEVRRFAGAQGTAATTDNCTAALPVGNGHDIVCYVTTANAVGPGGTVPISARFPVPANTVWRDGFSSAVSADDLINLKGIITTNATPTLNLSGPIAGDCVIDCPSATNGVRLQFTAAPTVPRATITVAAGTKVIVTSASSVAGVTFIVHGTLDIVAAGYSSTATVVRQPGGTVIRPTVPEDYPRLMDIDAELSTPGLAIGDDIRRIDDIADGYDFAGYAMEALGAANTDLVGTLTGYTGTAANGKPVTVSASSEFSATYAAWKPWSSVATDAWATPGITRDFVLSVAFEEAVYLESISIANRFNMEYPIAWYVEASMGGGGWVRLIDKSSGNEPLTNQTPISFPVPPGVYDRIRFVAITGNPTNPGLGEFRLFGRVINSFVRKLNNANGKPCIRITSKVAGAYPRFIRSSASEGLANNAPIWTRFGMAVSTDMIGGDAYQRVMATVTNPANREWSSEPSLFLNRNASSAAILFGSGGNVINFGVPTLTTGPSVFGATAHSGSISGILNTAQVATGSGLSQGATTAHMTLFTETGQSSGVYGHQHLRRFVVIDGHKMTDAQLRSATAAVCGYHLWRDGMQARITAGQPYQLLPPASTVTDSGVVAP